MGAEESILKSYDVDPPYNKCTFPKNEDGPDHSKLAPYSVHLARHRGNGSKASVFVYSKSLGPKIGASCAETLKLLRHPYILKFIGAVETDRHLKLLTEDVVPLSHVFHCLEALEIISGLHNVLEALIFLHEKVKLVHGNLNQFSIFVSNQDASWKLGCMEKASKSDESGIKFDIVCFAELARILLDVNRGEEEEMFLNKLETQYGEQEMLRGTELKDLLSEPIFMNGYLETVKFVNSITMKSESEKKLFFSRLGEKLRKLNPQTVGKKLLPKLMSKMILAEPFAEKLFIPHLWKFNDGRTSDYNPVLPRDEYLEYCVPLILKLLRSKQIHVRLILLKYISLYVQAIEKDVLEEDVLPLILIGLRDENDAIVTATFHGLANIVPVLGGSVVVGGERKKYFFDNRPNIGALKTLRWQEDQIPIDELTSCKDEGKFEDSESLMKQSLLKSKKSLQLKSCILKTEEINDNGLLDMAEEGVDHCSRQAATFERVEKATQDESEAEWEGFEAVTSESESEEKFEIEDVKGVKKTETLLTYTEDSFHSENEPIFVDEPEVTSLVHKPTSKATLIPKKQGIIKPTHSKRLGEEFEFDVEVRSEEPDFFADMQPNLAINKTIMVETNLQAVSSKFEAVGDQPDYGWEADDW